MASKQGIIFIINIMTPLTTTTERPSAGWWRFSGRFPHYYALIFWLFSLILFRQPLCDLARLSFRDELASHVLLIPVISGFLLYLERRRIFQASNYCPTLGVPLLVVILVLWFSLQTPLSTLKPLDQLSVVVAFLVLTWIGKFLLFFGTKAFRAALFPLLFLFLMSPIPAVVSEHLISALQKGSAETCYILFRVLRVPVIRHGLQFVLPGCEIEVAEQCSGIHAGLSLFIAGLLAEYALLSGAAKRTCFTLCIFPIAIFKNAVRIVTIAWLGIYVNPNFFHGALHRQGGVPFSLLAIGMMAVLIWLLRRPLTFTKVNDEVGI